MRQELKHRLVAWKNDLHAGETKKVILSISPVKEGELLIRLEKGLTETQSGKMKVLVTKKYVTEAQEDPRIDPAVDIDRLNRIIDSLEKEFNDRYEQVIDKTFSEIMQFSDN